MYHYTTYIKHFKDKSKNQKNTEIADNNTSEEHLFQIPNDNNNETAPIKTLLNQNLFERPNNIDQNKAENTRDTMILKKEEIKEAEAEKTANDIFKESEFINSLNNENPIIKGHKALILLGTDTDDLKKIANFLKEKKLNLQDTETGWQFIQEKPQEGVNISNILHISNQEEEQSILVYNSSYLNDDISPLELAIDIVSLQTILSTIPTKFILATKTIKNPNSFINELTDILAKFTRLLENVTINKDNLSIVVTDTSLSQGVGHISNIINKVIKNDKFSEKQKDIIEKLKNSIYLLPEASEQAQEYRELLNIIDNNDYITPRENNKITINDSQASKHILNFITAINDKIESNINNLRLAIEAKWSEEKSTVFKYIENVKDNLSFENVVPKTDNLKQLIDIVSDYKQSGGSNKTIENFLKIVKELYQILETPESENKLENFLNYLKYLSDIEFSGKENSNLINPSEWFKDLLSNLAIYNIKKEVLQSFKDTMHDDKYSFYNQLNETIEKFYENIQDNNVLNSQSIGNMYILKGFLSRVNNNTDIENLFDIERYLKQSIKHLPNIDNILPTIITNTISNLKNLIGQISEQEAKSLWKYITTSKSITEISQKLDKVIYDKLLDNEIPQHQKPNTYDLLEKLLIDSHKALDNSHKNEPFNDSLYNIQLAEIYCQKAQCYTLNNSPKLHKKSIELYEEAAKFDSTEANIKLGKIELHKANYIKALEHFKNTTCISGIEDAFNKLFQIKKSEINKIPESNTKNIAKSSLELAQLCLEQVEVYKEYELTRLAENTLELAKVIYLDTIAKLKNIGGAKNYDNLADMYNGLADITSPYTKHKYLKQAKEYSDLAKKFYSNKSETEYTSVTNTKGNYLKQAEKYDDLAKKFNEKDLETDYTTITTSTSCNSYFINNNSTYQAPLIELDELNNNSGTDFTSLNLNSKVHYGKIPEDFKNLLGNYSNYTYEKDV